MRELWPNPSNLTIERELSSHVPPTVYHQSVVQKQHSRSPLLLLAVRFYPQWWDKDDEMVTTNRQSWWRGKDLMERRKLRLEYSYCYVLYTFLKYSPYFLNFTTLHQISSSPCHLFIQDQVATFTINDSRPKNWINQVSIAIFDRKMIELILETKQMRLETPRTRTVYLYRVGS